MSVNMICSSKKGNRQSTARMVVLMLSLVMFSKASTSMNRVASSSIEHRRHRKPFVVSKRNAAVNTLLNIRGGVKVLGPPPSKVKTNKLIKNESPVSDLAASKLVAKEDHEGAGTDPKLLMMIRVLFVAFYGSLGSLMPYLPVYYHSLGHGGAAIGLLGAVKPLTTFLVAPLWGIVSDRTQNPALILQFTFVTSLLLQLSFCLRDEVNYLVTLGFLAALFNAPVKSLLDSMVLDNLSENEKGNYGKLRIWGQLGFGLGSGIVGWLLSHNPKTPTNTPVSHPFREEILDVGVEAAVAAAASEEFTDTALENLSQMLYSAIDYLKNIKGYHLAFLAHGILSIPAFLCMRSLCRIEKRNKKIISDKLSAQKRGSPDSKEQIVKKDGPHILEGLNLLLHNTDALLFFFLVFVVGTSSGCIENFAYVRIREVGGSGKEMGLSRLISSAAGAPMFWFSGSLTKKLGADKVLVLSLLSYVLRFFIYAFMNNPYKMLPAEALRGFTFAAFWSTGTIFAHSISPKGMGATMLMFLNAMYGGLGQSLGAIIGGKLQSNFGTVKTFIYAGIFDFIFACFAFTYLNFKTDSSFRNPKPMTKS